MERRLRVTGWPDRQVWLSTTFARVVLAGVLFGSFWSSELTKLGDG